MRLTKVVVVAVATGTLAVAGFAYAQNGASNSSTGVTPKSGTETPGGIGKPNTGSDPTGPNGHMSNKDRTKMSDKDRTKRNTMGSTGTGNTMAPNPVDNTSLKNSNSMNK